MAKKKSIPTAKSRGKVTFHAYMREPTEAPRVDLADRSEIPYVYHGSDNLYPEELRRLIDNAGPLERSVTQLSEFIAGAGVRFYDKEGNEIEAAQAKFQEWLTESTEEQFLAQTAYDIAHGLGMTWAVRRSATGEVVRLDHRSRFGFRAGKMDGGVIPAMYWSNNWKEAQWNATDDRFQPKPIPTIDWSGATKAPEAIVFERQYHPTEPVYGRIFWLGCKRAAEVWVKVDNYNRTQIDTGFTPAVMLGTRKEGTDDELDRHDERVEIAYSGSMGRGLFHFNLGPGEEEPFFQEITRGNHAGELDAIRDGSADVIYNTFGIPSLLLRDREEGLTSQSDAIAIRLQQFQRTVVATLQKLITRALTRLMNMEGVEVWETRIQPLEIFDPIESEAITMASTTVDQVRERRGDKPMEDEKTGKMLLSQAAKMPADPEQAERLADKKIQADQMAMQSGGKKPENKPVE